MGELREKAWPGVIVSRAEDGGSAQGMTTPQKSDGIVPFTGSQRTGV